MPHIIKDDRVDYNDIVQILKQGGVIVYPTDTAYALGADSASRRGIEKIYQIKTRGKNKTLPLIASSRAMVKKFAYLSKAEERLIIRYWPGPLTLLAKIRIKSGLVPEVMQNNYLAVRVPANLPAIKIARRLGRPIISTSANRSGEESCYSVKAVKKSLAKLWDKVDLVIDAGNLARVKPSTIVKLKNKNQFEVLRRGKIKIK